MAGLLALLLIASLAQAHAAVVPGESQKGAVYKCGSDCADPPMGSADPSSDALPHEFGPHVPTSPQGLRKAMNAYDVDAHDDAAVDSSFPRMVASMPESDGASPPSSVPLGDRIPYEPLDDGPALRRPCNLDEVLSLLGSVKKEFQLEDQHDMNIQSSLSAGNSALVAAKASVDQARAKVSELEAAKQANQTLEITLQNIALKNDLLKEHMDEKALLIKEEGMLKTPIVKSIGRTSINLQAAITAKQTALNDFAQHPAFTKEEMNELLATYDELIINIKQQLAASNKEASDVLTPVQLLVNQTHHTIERVKAEISELRKQQMELEPIAEKFTPASLEGAKLILADATSHFNAQTLASELDTKARDQRVKDRAGVLGVLDELVALVSDIQEPQDPNDASVVSGAQQQVVSLAGSVPKVPSSSPSSQ